MERMERIQESAAKSHIFPAQFTVVGRYMRIFLVIVKGIPRVSGFNLSPVFFLARSWEGGPGEES